MVHKDRRFIGWKICAGKKIAVPNRFFKQRLLIFRALKNAGMSRKMSICRNAAAGHAGCTYAKAVDAIQAASRSWVKPSSMGTAACFGSRKMSGRISFRVARVHEDMIKNDRDTVQRLVDGDREKRQVDRQKYGASNGDGAVREQVLLQSKSALAHLRPEQTGLTA